MDTHAARIQVLRMGALGIALFVAACVTITAPTRNQNVSGSTVAAAVSFRTPMCTSFSADLDGADVTGSFTGTGYGSGGGTAVLPVTPGTHALRVTADTQQFWFLIPYCAASSDSVTFTVQAGSTAQVLSFTPATLSVPTGSTVNATLGITPAPASNVSITLSSNTPMTATVPSTIMVTSGQPSGSVPVTGVNAGSASVTATLAGQSATLGVTVTPVTSVGTTLFRATNSGIEVLRFVPGATFAASTFQRISTVAATASPGMANVGLCFASPRLARASASAAEVFTVGGTATAPTLTSTAVTPATAGLSGVGSACAFTPAALVRVTDIGIETLAIGGTSISKLGAFTGTSASTGSGGSSVGVAAVADGNRVFRSVSSSLERYDVTTPAMPQRTTNFIGVGASSTGTALAWLVPGTMLVRSTNASVEVINVTGATLSVAGTNITGGASVGGVALDASGTRILRGTDFGVEIYDATTPTAPVRCAARNGGLSSTGVGVVMRGGVAFRATNTSIEAYDLSSVSCGGTVVQLPAPIVFQTGLAASTSGVALAAP